MRPELASSGATPLWRASCASVLKRPIGPISASSFAAVTAPQPGSSSSAGAVSAVRCSSSRSSSTIVRVSERQRDDELARDAHLHLLLAAGEPAADALEMHRPVEPPQRARRRSGRAGAGASAAAAGSAAARRRDRRGGRPAASAHETPARPAAAGSAPARAAPPGRPRARRSGPTCRACLPARRSGTISFGGTRTSSSPRREQLPLEPARQLPAILDRPQPLTRRAPPPSRAARRCRPATVVSSSIRPGLVDRDSGHRLLVYVHSDHDHSASPPPTVGGDRRADRPQSRREPRSYQVTLDGLGRRRRHNAGQVSPRATFGMESAAAARVCAATGRHHHDASMTLSSGMSLDSEESRCRGREA